MVFSWKQKLTFFYSEVFLKMKDIHSRQRFEASILLIIKEFQLMSIVLSNLENYYSQWMTTFIKVIKFTKIYPIICNNDEQCILWIEVFIECFLIILFAYFMVQQYIIKLLIHKTNQQLLMVKEQNMQTGQKLQQIPLLINSNHNINIDNGNIQIIITVCNNIVSIFLQTYEYLIFQPLFYLLLKNIIVNLNTTNTISLAFGQSILSLIFLPLIIIVQLIVTQHKFQFRFKSQDVLGIFNNVYIYILPILNIIVIIFQVISENNQYNYVTQSLLIIYLIVSLISGMCFRCYQDLETQYFNNQMTFQIFLIIIIFLIEQISNYQMNSLTAIQLYFFLAAFIYQITRLNYQFYNKTIFLNFQLENCNIQELDRRLRFIYQQSIQIFLPEYQLYNKPQMQNYNSILLYNLLSNHVQQCDGINLFTKQECFCQQYFPRSVNFEEKKTWKKYTQQKQDLDESFDESKYEIFNDKDFKKFTQHFIQNEFENFIQQNKNVSIEIHLSYIYFLIEVPKIPTKAFVEALNLLKISRFNDIYSQMLIQTLLQIAKQNFLDLVQKKQIKNQKYQLHTCFDLDQSYQIVNHNMAKTIEQIKEWYSVILHQKNNIEKIYLRGQNVLENITLIEKQLNAIFSANPLASEIEQLYQLFYKYIHTHKKRDSKYKKHSQITNNFINSYNKDMFNKDSCVVYITLLYPIGKIIRFTSNFAQMSGVQDQAELQTNINNFMPDLLAKYHDGYLQTFCDKGRMNIVNSEHRFLLLKRKEQFVVPVIAKIKLEDSYDNDFGASALITKVNTQNHYLLLNQYCLLEEISQEFYVEIKKLLRCSVKNLKGIDCFLLIPQLWLIWKQLSFDEDENSQTETNNFMLPQQAQYDFNLFLPKVQSNILHILRNRPNPTRKPSKYLQSHPIQLFQYFDIVEDVSIYQFKLKIIPIRTISQNLYILEIQSLRKLKKMKQLDKLNKLQHILNSIFPQHAGQKQQKISPVNISNLDDFMSKEETIYLEKISNFLPKLSCQPSSSKQITLLQPTLSFQKISNNIPSSAQRQLSSETYSESSNDLAFLTKNDKVDQHSISSQTKFQDQIGKRNIVRSFLFESEFNANFLFLLFLLIIFTIFLLSTLIFGFIISQQNFNDEIYETNDFTNILNRYYIYLDCNEQISSLCIQLNKEMLLSLNEITLQFSNYQSEFNYDQFNDEQKQNYSNLLYEINIFNNLILKSINLQDENSIIQLILNYQYFQQIFTFMSSYLTESFYNDTTIDFSKVLVCQLISQIIIILFSLLIIPFEFLMNRKKSSLLKLFSKLNRQFLIKQYTLFQSLCQVDDTKNYILKENQEDQIDTSKNVQSDNGRINSQISLIRKDNQNKITHQKQITYANSTKILLQIIIIILVVIIIESYFIITYTLSVTDQNQKIQMYDEYVNYISIQQSIQQTSSHLALLNLTRIYGYENQVISTIINNNIVELVNSWQIFLEQLTYDDDQVLNNFANNSFCDIFINNFTTSIINFQICENQNVLNTGLIVLITNLINFYNQIITSLDQNQLSSNTYQLLNSEYQDIQIVGTFLNIGMDNFYYTLSNYNSQQVSLISTQSLVAIYSIYIIILLIILKLGLIYQKYMIEIALKKTKQLLTLIPIDTILENSYIMGYILSKHQIQHNT